MTKSKSHILPKLILFGGLVFSLAIVLFINNQIDKKIVKINKESVDDFELKISLAFTQYIHPLQGIASVYHAKNHKLTPIDFFQLAESRNFFKDFPGALGFGFINFIKEKNINEYLSNQKIYNPDFQLRRLAPNDTSPFTKDYFVIEVVEPKSINHKAIGLVVSDEQNRYDAAIKSMREGKPTITRPIQLVQDNTKVPGFLLFYPIYKTRSIPKTELERINNFLGWAYTPIISSAVFDFVKKLQLSIPPVNLYEISNPDKSLFKTSISTDSINQKDEVTIFGTTWVVEYDKDHAAEYDYHHLILFLVFLVLNGASGMFSFILQRNLKKIELLEEDEKRFKDKIHEATLTIDNQRNFYKKLIDSIPSLVSYWNQDLANVFCNQEYLNFFDKKPDEVHGAYYWTLYPDSLFQKDFVFIKEALEGKSPTFSREMVSADGTLLNYIVKVIPDFNHQNEVIGFYVVESDVTTITKKESQIHLLLEVIESAPVAIEITDRYKKIEYVNSHHCEMTGYAKDEVVGNCPSSFASGKTPRSTFIQLNEDLKNKGHWSGEFINKKKSGEDYYEEAIISVITDKKGEVSHYVAIKKDVTLAKKNESQLIFNSKLATLGEMAAGVAHEINNPLAIIQMSVDSMSKKAERNNLSVESMNDSIGKIKKNVDRIFKIVKSLKLYTRDTSNEEFKKVTLSSIISSVTDLTQEKIKFKNIPFEILNQKELVLECNEVKIQQVLVNLLNNAIDAIAESEKPWIRVYIESDHDFVYFKVMDSGRIDKTVVDKMFNPFFTTKAIGKGTGLGLSVSLTIAKEHSGTIYLDQGLNNTCFVLKVPMVQSKNQEIENSKAS